MNILHVIPSFHPAYSYGGPIRSSYELCRNLALLGCDVRVLTTDANGLDAVLDVVKDREVLFEDGFWVRYCRRRMRHSVSPQLVRMLGRYVSWADVVHLTGVYNFPTFPTLLYCRILKKPVVWSPRGGLQRWRGSSRRVPKEIWDSIWYNFADHSRLIMHCTSQEEALETKARLPKVRSAVIPNGVDVPSTLSRTEAYGLLRLLYIGRLDPKKGVESLLEACSMMAGKNWHLAIAGWGVPSYVAHLKQRVNELGLGQQVELIGTVLDGAKKQLFENSDVVLVPSHTENFAIVVAEALAHGVPVIASKGTPWSALEMKQCGFWVDNDPETLLDAVARISTMPLQEMGQRGRAWMQAEFSWASVSKQMLALYRKCLHRPSQTNDVGRHQVHQSRVER
jgi:glycosyltransferase involved in cell wall biosynthesis